MILYTKHLFTCGRARWLSSLLDVFHGVEFDWQNAIQTLITVSN